MIGSTSIRCSVTAITVCIALSLVPQAIAFTCETPTSLSVNRLPAILEVENLCQTHRITMCLEYGGSDYLILNVPPGELVTIPTRLEDCWIFRATDCSGEILMEHSVTGTRKLATGCNHQETADMSIQLSQSVPLFCALTQPPLLDDVFISSKEHLPTNVRDLLDQTHFSDLQMPTQHVNELTLLNALYTTCFELARHRVKVHDVIRVFRHFRGLLWHTRKCHPQLVGSLTAIPVSYIGIYGVAFAHLRAKSSASGAWIENPPALTTAQQQSFEKMRDDAVGYPVWKDLPESLYPGANQGIPPPFVPAQRMAIISAVEQQIRLLNTSSRSVSGQPYCDQDPGQKWTYFKITAASEPNNPANCCARGCLAFPAVGSFSVKSFQINCCMRCNWGGCSTAITSATRVVLDRAEVQMPTESVTTMREARRVTL